MAGAGSEIIRILIFGFSEYRSETLVKCVKYTQVTHFFPFLLIECFILEDPYSEMLWELEKSQFLDNIKVSISYL